VPFRTAYLQALVDVIEVDDTQIRIKDSKDVLERTVNPIPQAPGGIGCAGS
jgi:hypothetical protein